MKTAVSGILALSAVMIGFLFWLIYFQDSPHSATTEEARAFVPAMNAVFNAISSTFIALGGLFIKRGNKQWHIRMMIGATLSSTCFLIGYIYYHFSTGHTTFGGEGVIRSIYFFILITHIVLAAVALPLVLTTLYFAKKELFELHKKIARYTLPIWLYVSVTGVLIFVIIELFNKPVVALPVL